MFSSRCQYYGPSSTDPGVVVLAETFSLIVLIILMIYPLDNIQLTLSSDSQTLFSNAFRAKKFGTVQYNYTGLL